MHQVIGGLSLTGKLINYFQSVTHQEYALYPTGVSPARFMIDLRDGRIVLLAPMLPQVDHNLHDLSIAFGMNHLSN